MRQEGRRAVAPRRFLRPQSKAGIGWPIFAGPTAPAGDLLCHCSVKGTVQIEQSSVAPVDAFVDRGRSVRRRKSQRFPSGMC